MTSKLRELLHNFSVPTMYDQDFGLGLDITPNGPSTLSPFWSWVNSSSIINEKDEFQVSLDVQQFKPEELSVNIKGDSVVVTGKHEEKKDQHGYVSREFTRRYQLPETVDSNALKASLSSDGVLQLSAPIRAVQGVNIPIIKTNITAAALLNGGGETATICNSDSKTGTVNGDTTNVSVNGNSDSATVNGDSTTATVNDDSTTATVNSDSTTTTVNGDSTTATVNDDSTTATVNSDSTTATVNGDSTTATVNSDSTTATVNGDSTTATVNSDSTTATENGVTKHKQSPTSSPLQPVLKKPRVDVDN